jgi:hypothetical protein
MHIQQPSDKGITAELGDDPPTLIPEQDAELAGIHRQLASIRGEVDELPMLIVDELPMLIETLIEGLLTTLLQELVLDIKFALERADAEEDEHFSPQDLVDGLNDYRTRGYEFFCVHAERYQGDSEFAAAEESLRALANTPIRPGTVKANRRELGGWMAIVNGTFSEMALNKDGSVKKAALLSMARYVVLCGGGEVAAKPVEQLWPALEADVELRDSLRALYTLGPPRSTESSGSGRSASK